MAISLFFSINIYSLATREFNRGYARQNDLISNPPQDFPSALRSQLIETRQRLINEAEARVVASLVFTNVVVFIFGGCISYILARRSLRPIEEAHEALERFTADASHELRTPIAAMQSEIEVALMEKRISSTEARQLLKSVLEELETLTKLSDGLLKIARMENGSLTLSRQLIEPVILDAVNKVLPRAEEKHILITTKISEKAKALINESSIGEALVVVLDNAVKYSPEKSEVIVTGSTKDRTTIITIADRGMGIAKKDIPYIFDRFYRADAARSKQSTSGHGLGLSIAKQIIDHHNGSIGVKSGKNGSQFTIQLPA